MHICNIDHRGYPFTSSPPDRSWRTKDLFECRAAPLWSHHTEAKKVPKALRPSQVLESGYQPAFAPRGLSRIESARHVGVSPSLFDEMVRDGRMPQPKQINARILWDRVKLEAFFEALPERQGSNAEADGDTFADWQ